LGGLLVGLVLLLNALVASSSLHELLHHDAGQPEHQCAVTLFAHGQVESVTPVVAIAAPLVWTELALPSAQSSLSSHASLLPLGRAPPVFI
jgi:hypothetical protein